MPSDWLYLAGNNIAARLDRDLSRFVPIGGKHGAGISGFQAIEGNTQLLARAAYTWLNISARVTANNLDATTSVFARVGGVDQAVLEVQIAANTTGYFEDTTGSVAVAVADLINYRLQAGSGAHGDTISFSLIAGQLQHASLERPMVIAAAPVVEFVVAQGITGFAAIVGNPGADFTGETSAEYILRQGVTFSNMRVVVSANNTDNASTFDLREDGVSSTNLTISIAANTTGAFEDTDSEAISSGSTVNYRMVAGAGMSGDAIVVTLIHMLQEGSVASRNLGVTGVTTFVPGDTIFLPIEGNFALSTVEVDNQVEAPVALEVKNMFVQVDINTLSTAGTDIDFRVNGANSALGVSIAAGSTGTFEDTTDTISVALNDLINWSIDVATGGTGSMRPILIALEQGQVIVPEGPEVIHFRSLEAFSRP